MSTWPELIGNVVAFLFTGAMLYLLVVPLPDRKGSEPDQKDYRRLDSGRPP